MGSQSEMLIFDKRKGAAIPAAPVFYIFSRIRCISSDRA